MTGILFQPGLQSTTVERTQRSSMSKLGICSRIYLQFNYFRRFQSIDFSLNDDNEA